MIKANMKKHNEKGMSAIEGLLIIVLVAIIGFVGWYVWHSKQNADNSLKQASKSSSSQAATIKKGPTQTKQRYLDIKEWGIKLPLSASIEDAYYVVSTNSETNGQPNTVWLGLKSLDGSGCAAAQANSGGAYPIGAIIKAQPNETDLVSGTAIKQLNPDGVTLSEFYYAYHSGIQGSSPTRCITKANIANANAIDAAFRAGASKITAE